MTVAAYIRISSTSQSLEAQRDALKKWLRGNGHELDQVQWFEDVESGKNLDRPGYKALEKALFNGEVKTVVAYKLDRLARSQKDGINLIADWCDRGIRLVIVTLQLDLNEKINQVVANLLFGIADIEREFIRERQAAGIETAKKQGVYKGRKPGTKKGDPARARELRAQGLKIKEIASAMDLSVSTINNYLADPI